MIDPIADMLTRIRNASLVKKSEILLPMSKVKFNVAKILEKEGFVKREELIICSKGGFIQLEYPFPQNPYAWIEENIINRSFIN